MLMPKLYLRRVVDDFLLRHAEATIRGYSATQRQLIRRLNGAAAVRIASADKVAELSDAPAAVAVYREAARLLISAVVASKDANVKDSPLELGLGARRLCELVQSGALPALPSSYSEAMRVLEVTDPLQLDDQAPEKADDHRSSVEEFLRWLRRQIEPRSLASVRGARLTRVAFVSAILAGLMTWVISSLVAPRNLALHRRVIMSSQFPETPNPQGATDGKFIPPFQAHTAIERDPWITVDLGARRKISEVRIYNRAYELFADALPLTLEFSTDNIKYRAVDRRIESFTDSEPWVFRARGEPSRFVRIHGHPDGYVVVTEIEVFGR